MIQRNRWSIDPSEVPEFGRWSLPIATNLNGFSFAPWVDAQFVRMVETQFPNHRPILKTGTIRVFKALLGQIKSLPKVITHQINLGSIAIQAKNQWIGLSALDL